MSEMVTVLSTLVLTPEAEKVMRLPLDSDLTEDQVNALRPFFNVKIAPHPQITPDDVRKNLGSLASALPSQRTDNDTGRLKLAVYQTMLLGYPLPALKAACRQCLEELEWFPAPKQLIDRIKRWRCPEEVKLLVLQIKVKKFDHDKRNSNEPGKALTQRDIDDLANSAHGKTLITLGVACGYIVKDEKGRYRPAPDKHPSGT
ncbi:MAG: hypothetical protein U5K75_11110 [Ahrensia sp.]|nr:hypothetical protein [Ahrensia sp.]